MVILVQGATQAMAEGEAPKLMESVDRVHEKYDEVMEWGLRFGLAPETKKRRVVKKEQGCVMWLAHQGAEASEHDMIIS